MNKAILINGHGREYNLLDSTLSPGFQIEGLGYADDTDFLIIGGRYYPLEENSEQKSLETTLLFMDAADSKYYEFVKFARHNPLTMLYGNQNGEFYIPCRLRSISKVDQLGIRRYPAPVQLTQMGRPYRIITAECKSGVGTEGKIYPYVYDYKYANEGANKISIGSDSYLNSACILTIYGSADAPIWRHYLNGELVETGAYSGTIPSGNRLVIDSRSMPQSIIEYDAAGMVVADRYQLCDFSTERFMHVGEGDNRYVLSHNGITDLAAKVEAYIEYEAI